MLTAGGNRQPLQVVSLGYSTVGATSVLSAPTNQQLLVHSYSGTNASGATVDLGLGVSYAPQGWKLIALGAANTDVTAQIQAGTATTIVGTTNNYGYLVQAKHQFGYLVLNLSQASTGSPVYSYQYWNGTSWVTLTLLQTPVYSATGTVYVTFQAPADWQPGNAGEAPAFNSVFTGYCIRVRATTAPTQAVQANSMIVARWIAYRQAIGSKQNVQVLFLERPYLLEALENLIPFFSTANASNSVEVAYQINP